MDMAMATARVGSMYIVGIMTPRSYGFQIRGGPLAGQKKLKTIKIYEDPSKSVKINQNPSESIKIHQDPSESIKLKTQRGGVLRPLWEGGRMPPLSLKDSDGS